MRGNRTVITVAVVATVGAAVLVSQFRPVAAAAPNPLPSYRVGYASDDTTTLMVTTPGSGVTSALLGAAGNVDFDASANATGTVWVSDRTRQPGARQHDGQLFFQRADGGPPVALTNDGPVNQFPALSPDGTQVAFAAEQPGQPGVTNIFVVPVTGGAARQVTTDTAADTWPAWSPDGTQLAFSSTKDNPSGDIYTIPVAGGTETRITTDPGAATQPAWSPLGTRIAFTTTRFHASGDIALVTLADDTVAGAIPGDTGDSTEAAWSPDGTRIAFTTHRGNSPLGAVDEVVLATSARTTIAADTGLGDTHPTWSGGRVVFTQLHAGTVGNVFTADAAGNDRHDLTNDPAVDVGGPATINASEPAFSADGTQVAYTVRDTNGVGRVMLADAGGGNPHALTAADPGSEQNPAWSPDGTMIALSSTRGTGAAATHVVLIVAVADGRILGQVPMPPQLATDDTQPTWSPDGTHIAMQRTATRIPQPVSHIDPTTVDRPAAAGSTFDVSEIVHTTKVLASADIVFLTDATGSEGDVDLQLQQDVAGIADGVHARDPNARFGIASYADPEDNPADTSEDTDARFDTELPLAAQPTDAQLAQTMHDLYLSPLGDGLDPPKDWIHGLDQLATTTAFRPRTDRIVVLLGDSSSNDPDPADGADPAHPTLADTIAHLTAAGIRVVGVPITGYGDGLDGQGQASRLIRATGGALLAPVTDPGQLSQLGTEIANGIAGLPPVFESVTVTPVVTHCDTGLAVTFDPSGDETVAGGADATFTEHVGTAAGATIGATLGCTVEFRIDGEPTVRAGYTETITVHVRDPALPVVVVGSVATDATSANGAVITYSATATDAHGNQLTPTCTPASGGTFPVGVTVVSCTATDSAGNSATETATMTVFPANPAVSSIWTVRLVSPPAGGLAITDQIDTSVHFDAPCAGGPDAAPDWSPDGKSLAFAHGNGARSDPICVADVAGTNAHTVATETGPLAGALLGDPAWSPDGALIAFGATIGAAAPAIWTVTATGGPPQALITTPGGAAQPAFQREPDLVVNAAAAPASVPFGTRTTLRFTVDNDRGSVTASNAKLVLGMPAGLRPEQISTDTGTCAAVTLVCALGAMAPGRTAVVQVVVTGVEPGPQVVRATASSSLLTANPSEADVTVTVTVGPRLGHLSVLTGVAPSPAYVGGDDIVVSYTVSNAGDAVMTAVHLATTLPSALGVPKSVSPAGCRADGTGCDLGSLQPGQTVQVKYVLAAAAAVNVTETGTITTTGPDTSVADHTASAPLVVGQPVLTIDPTVGPQGFVVHATGSGFPPGAVLALTWSPGVSPTPGQVTVAANGTLDTQVLIFHHDQVGPRVLIAAPVSGPRFGQVSSPSFLVVPRGDEPPLFNNPN